MSNGIFDTLWYSKYIYNFYPTCFENTLSFVHTYIATPTNHYTPREPIFVQTPKKWSQVRSLTLRFKQLYFIPYIIQIIVGSYIHVIVLVIRKKDYYCIIDFFSNCTGNCRIILYAMRLSVWLGNKYLFLGYKIRRGCM